MPPQNLPANHVPHPLPPTQNTIKKHQKIRLPHRQNPLHPKKSPTHDPNTPLTHSLPPRTKPTHLQKKITKQVHHQHHQPVTLTPRTRTILKPRSLQKTIPFSHRRQIKTPVHRNLTKLKHPLRNPQHLL